MINSYDQNSESRQFAACLSTLLKAKHNDAKEIPLRYNSFVVFNELAREGAWDDEHIIDLRKVGRIYPIHFVQRLPYQENRLRSILQQGEMCILEFHEQNGKFNYASCLEISAKNDVIIADAHGKTSQLNENQNTPGFILHFISKEPTNPISKTSNTPRDTQKFLQAIKICQNERQKARAQKTGGTAWPGHKARVFYPDVVQYVFSDVQNLICVLGTNGKTTTCRMIGSILSSCGIGYAHNREGGNMLDALLTTLLLNYDDRGQLRENTVILECDELCFSEISHFMRPKIIVITNLYSDQEYRLNNVETVTACFTKALLNCPEAVVCLNNDSDPCRQIAAAIPNRKIFYNIKNDEVLIDGEKIALDKINHSDVYQYNGAAACAFARAYGLSLAKAVSAVQNTEPAFGRMETLQLGSKKLLLEMLKNPASFNAFLNYAREHRGSILIMAIWDPNVIITKWMEKINFAPLFNCYDQIYVTGTGPTAATFLRYPNIQKLPEATLVDRIKHAEQDVTILTDYNGNITIHQIFSENGYLRLFWEY